MAVQYDLDQVHKVLDGLYQSGYDDASKERDYDPRGTDEWQVALDFIIPLRSTPI